MKKYEITNIPHPTIPGIFRIRATATIGGRTVVNAGTLGGYVESEWNLSRDGTCWIGDNACAIGNARVTRNARMSGDAIACGNARICGNSCVGTHAEISGNAIIFHCAIVGGWAKITDNARVGGHAHITGYTRVCHKARISSLIVAHSAELGDLTIHKKMILNNHATISYNSDIIYYRGITAYKLRRAYGQQHIIDWCYSGVNKDNEKYKAFLMLKLE